MLIARPVPRPVAVLLAVVAVVGALSVDRHDPILLLNVSLVGLAALTLTLILYRLDIRHATPLSAAEPLDPVEPIPPWRALVPGVSWQTDDRLLLQDIQAHDETVLACDDEAATGVNDPDELAEVSRRWRSSSGPAG